MKVAIVHYWMVSMRGGERVTESLCRMFPDADVFTNYAIRENLSSDITRHKIIETFIARLPFVRKLYSRYLPLMPLALEQLDLTSYDLIISSEAGPSKGVIPGPNAVHLTYCHSPMRYVWDQYHVYRNRSGIMTRAVMPLFCHYLRQWDISTTTRVDAFLANSGHVARRIRRYYNRPAEVVYPPVAVEEFRPVPPSERGDFYLWCGELVRYKRGDLAIDAFNASGRKLVVIGRGEDFERLRKIAKPNIIFLGSAKFDVLKHHLSRCQALIFPGEEDFGIVPVEAQASGRPVIAYAKGGALETVIDGKTGLYFHEQSGAALNAAIDEFEASGLGDRCESDCRANSLRFSETNFQTGIATALKTLGVEVPDLRAGSQ